MGRLRQDVVDCAESGGSCPKCRRPINGKEELIRVRDLAAAEAEPIKAQIAKLETRKAELDRLAEEHDKASSSCMFIRNSMHAKHLELDALANHAERLVEEAKSDKEDASKLDGLQARK